MERSGPISFLFSPENRPWILAIIVSMVALTTVLLLSGSDGSTDATPTTTLAESAFSESSDDAAGPDGAGSEGGTIDALPGTPSADECSHSAAALSLAASGGFGPTGQVDSAQIDEAFERMSAVAPADIADDLAIMAAALREFFSILQEENIDLNDPTSLAAPEAATAFERAGAALESSGFTQAADEVSAWFESACGEFISS